MSEKTLAERQAEADQNVFPRTETVWRNGVGLPVWHVREVELHLMLQGLMSYPERIQPDFHRLGSRLEGP